VLNHTTNVQGVEQSDIPVTPEGEGWRDIASAPRDGTTIEAWFPLRGLSAHWSRQVRVWWRDDSYHTGWIWEGRAVRGFSDEYQPSHWRPVESTTEEDEQAKIYVPPRFPARPRVPIRPRHFDGHCHPLPDGSYTHHILPTQQFPTPGNLKTKKL
jgi:hypothetical protein